MIRHDALSIMRRRGLLFLAVAVGVYATVVIALFVLPARYVATSSIIVAEQTASVDGAPPIGSDKVGDPADVESQIVQVRAPRLLRLVIARPDVRALPLPDCDRTRDASSCANSTSGSDALLDYLQQHYSVSAVGRSRVINIAFDAGSPLVAQTLSNALTITFLDDRRQSLVGIAQRSAQSLRQERQQLGQSLQADNDQIRAFRSQNGLIRGSIAPISSERLSSISQSLVAAEAAKAEAATRMDEIEKASRTDAMDSPIVRSNRTINDLRQQLIALDVEYARSSSVLGPRHPALISLDQARDMVKSRIGAELRVLVAGAKTSYETASALVDSLRAKMLGFEAEATSAEDREASIADLVQRAETKKARYEDLSRQIARLEIEAPAYSDGTKLVNLAELPASPYFPKRAPFLIGGLVLALLFGSGAAIVAERASAGRLQVDPVRSVAGGAPESIGA